MKRGVYLVLLLIVLSSFALAQTSSSDSSSDTYIKDGVEVSSDTSLPISSDSTTTSTTGSDSTTTSTTGSDSTTTSTTSSTSSSSIPNFPTPSTTLYDEQGGNIVPPSSDYTGTESYTRRETVWVWDPETQQYIVESSTITEIKVEGSSQGSPISSDQAFSQDFYQFLLAFFSGQQVPTESEGDTTIVDGEEVTTPEDETTPEDGEEQVYEDTKEETTDETQETEEELIPECIESEDGTVSGYYSDFVWTDGEVDACYDEVDSQIQIVDSCSGSTCMHVDVYCTEDNFVDFTLTEGVNCQNGKIYDSEEQVEVSEDLICTETEDGFVSGIYSDGEPIEGYDSCYLDYEETDSCSGTNCMAVDFFCTEDQHVDVLIAEGVSCENGAIIESTESESVAEDTEAVVTDIPAECNIEDGLVTGYWSDGEYADGEKQVTCYEFYSETDFEEVNSCSGESCMRVELYCDTYVDFNLEEGVSCSGATEALEAAPEGSECYIENGMIYGYYSDGEFVDGEIISQCYIETSSGEIEQTDSCAGETCMNVQFMCVDNFVDFDLITDTECEMGVSSGEGVYDPDKVENKGKTPKKDEEGPGFFGWVIEFWKDVLGIE